jgi:CNT family concentrative nucleoside transporter
MLGNRLIAIVGALAMAAIAYALSRKRKSISWKVVVWGLASQWAIALVLLKFEPGRQALKAVAELVQGVLNHSFAGSEFLFGPLGAMEGGESGLGALFAFQVLPTIIFVAALFGALYYLGVMQLIVGVLARLMVRTMGTSGAESLSVAASVFMGQTEAPLTIRPFLSKLTESELFLVMVAGMASVSGAILGAYVLIGKVSMEHLLTAVAMTAPASIYMAKLMIPEDGEPTTLGEAKLDVPKVDANLLDAIARGAGDGLKLALNVGAMLIAFIALVSLANWMLGVVDLWGEPLSLQRVFGWLFSPIAFLMGVPWEEATTSGSILGTRTIVNELVAFGDLRGLQETLTPRTYAITTFAICGFASISSIGIQIGGLGALAPERKGDIARLGVRALVAATLANFSTACVAGALL